MKLNHINNNMNENTETGKKLVELNMVKIENEMTLQLSSLKLENDILRDKVKQLEETLAKSPNHTELEGRNNKKNKEQLIF